LRELFLAALFILSLQPHFVFWTTRSMSKKASSDDSDLEDLVGSETAPLNLDHLTKATMDVSGSRYQSNAPGISDLVSAQCSYLCYAYPCCCGTVTFFTVGMVMFLLLSAVTNPYEYFGLVGDASFQSQLSTANVDHWCLKGDNDSCRCDDPLEPMPRTEFKTWSMAHKANKESIQAYVDSENLDVAFIGESLVEEMDGRWMGRTQAGVLKEVSSLFQQNFSRDKSGIEGIALGVAGDTCPNVLYRLQHGEMPKDFNPRVWWIVLGMNDIGRMQCSEEIVVMGIMRIVEEIQRHKPDAKIVINSMLPMADLRGGMYPLMNDYKDGLRSKTLNTAIARPKNFPAGAGVGTSVKYYRPKTTTTVLEKHHHPEKFVRPIPKMDIEEVKEDETEKEEDKEEKEEEEKDAKEDKKEEEEEKQDAKEDKKEKEEAKEEKEDKKEKEEAKEEKEDKKEKEEAKEEKEDKKEKEEAKEEKEDKKEKEEAKEEKEDVDKDEKDEKEEKAKKEERRQLRTKARDGEDDENGQRPPMTKEQLRAMEKYSKRIKHDPINPKIYSDRTRIKKRDPKSLFMRQTRLPLWTSIYSINKALKKFANSEEQTNVFFFDATKIFAERDQGSRYVLRSDRISIRGHPTHAGFRSWEEAIVSKLKDILEKQDAELAIEADDADGN